MGINLQSGSHQTLLDSLPVQNQVKPKLVKFSGISNSIEAITQCTLFSLTTIHKDRDQEEIGNDRQELYTDIS